jgi:hypothetical protein
LARTSRHFLSGNRTNGVWQMGTSIDPAIKHVEEFQYASFPRHAVIVDRMGGNIRSLRAHVPPSLADTCQL